MGGDKSELGMAEPIDKAGMETNPVRWTRREFVTNSATGLAWSAFAGKLQPAATPLDQAEATRRGP